MRQREPSGLMFRTKHTWPLDNFVGSPNNCGVCCRFDLSKEMEQRQSTEILLTKVRDQLTMKEEQLTRWVDGGQTCMIFWP